MEETSIRLEELLERRLREGRTGGISRSADVALLDAIHRWRYQEKLRADDVRMSFEPVAGTVLNVPQVPAGQTWGGSGTD